MLEYYRGFKHEKDDDRLKYLILQTPALFGLLSPEEREELALLQIKIARDSNIK